MGDGVACAGQMVAFLKGETESGSGLSKWVAEEGSPKASWWCEVFKAKTQT